MAGSGSGAHSAGLGRWTESAMIGCTVQSTRSSGPQPATVVGPVKAVSSTATTTGVACAFPAARGRPWRPAAPARPSPSPAPPRRAAWGRPPPPARRCRSAPCTTLVVMRRSGPSVPSTVAPVRILVVEAGVRGTPPAWSSSTWPVAGSSTTAPTLVPAMDRPGTGPALRRPLAGVAPTPAGGSQRRQGSGTDEGVASGAGSSWAPLTPLWRRPRCRRQQPSGKSRGSGAAVAAGRATALAGGIRRDYPAGLPLRCNEGVSAPHWPTARIGRPWRPATTRT